MPRIIEQIDDKYCKVLIDPPGSITCPICGKEIKGKATTFYKTECLKKI